MAANIGKLARRYAKALLKALEADSSELALEGAPPTKAQQLATSLLQFARFWEEESEFSSTISNPMFDREQRLQALLRAARELAGLPEMAQRFLRVVFERERILALPEIARAFSELADACASVVQVDVTVASELAVPERENIEACLSEKITGSLRFGWSADPALLGGMIVRYQGRVLDGSLRGRLAQIEGKLRGH